MKNNINVYIKLEKNSTLPQYASKKSAGCDLFATKDMVIRPSETIVMPLDFIMAIDSNVEAQIRPRSGLSLKTDLRIPNGPGTIDSDYRDIVGVILQNTYNIASLPYKIAQEPEILSDLQKSYREIDLKEYLSKEKNFDTSEFKMIHILEQKIYIDRKGNPFGTIYISKGERIAQMIFCEYKRAFFIHHENPKKIGEDRGGGFGHTGTK